MALGKDDIQKLGALARIEIDATISGDVAAKLSDILGMIEQMQALDTASVEPMANPLDAVQRLRADEVTEGDQRERLLAIAPATEDGLFLVPRVID
jgi:aspartyl-tRNA(Asn)/glutamyl-tRNA(Gln) amidotransferase subunit C